MRNINISSAEITGFFRCSYPMISQDNVSKKLISSKGIADSYQFIADFNYPLMPRLISVRAGYILQQASEILNTNDYDACISIASGFSLLTFLLNEKVKKDILFIDCDLEEVIKAREQRINSIPFLKGKMNNLLLKPFDTNKLSETNSSLKDFFKGINNALFIIEGLSYFLENQTMYWLIREIANYGKSALIFDFCSFKESKCLKNLLKNIPGFMHNSKALEQISNKEIYFLKEKFNNVILSSISDIDNRLSCKLNEDFLLKDLNNFLPISILVAK